MPKTKTNGTPAAVDPLTCEHQHVVDLKDGMRLCNDCNTELLPEREEKIAKAIARNTAAMLRGTSVAQGKPPKPKRPRTMWDELVGTPAEEDNDGEGFQ